MRIKLIVRDQTNLALHVYGKIDIWGGEYDTIWYIDIQPTYRYYSITEYGGIEIGDYGILHRSITRKH